MSCWQPAAPPAPRARRPVVCRAPHLFAAPRPAAVPVFSAPPARRAGKPRVAPTAPAFAAPRPLPTGGHAHRPKPARRAVCAPCAASPPPGSRPAASTRPAPPPPPAKPRRPTPRANRRAPPVPRRGTPPRDRAAARRARKARLKQSAFALCSGEVCRGKGGSNPRETSPGDRARLSREIPTNCRGGVFGHIRQ